MMSSGWDSRKEIWKQEALAAHARMSRLFVENRFQFELERKRLIEGVINKPENEDISNSLQQLQEKWDGILKNAGSSHNRMVLIQMLFWEWVTERFGPALNSFQK